MVVWWVMFLLLIINWGRGEYCDWIENVFEECVDCGICHFIYLINGSFQLSNREGNDFYFLEPKGEFELNNLTVNQILIQNPNKSTFNFKTMNKPLDIVLFETDEGKETRIEQMFSLGVTECSNVRRVVNQNISTISVVLTKAYGDGFEVNCIEPRMIEIDENISVSVGNIENCFSYLYSSQTINNPLINDSFYIFTSLHFDGLFHYFIFNSNQIVLLGQDHVQNTTVTSIRLLQNNLHLFLVSSSFKVFYEFEQLELNVHCFPNTLLEIYISFEISKITFMGIQNNITTEMFHVTDLGNGYLKLNQFVIDNITIYDIKINTTSGYLFLSSFNDFILLEGLNGTNCSKSDNKTIEFNTVKGCNYSLFNSDSFICFEKPLSCKENQYLNEEKQCVYCKENCLKCENSSYCILCDGDHINADGDCEIKEDYCKEVPTNCYFCDYRNAYYVENCNNCDYPCFTCLGNKCIECLNGYFLDQNNSCVEIDANSEISNGLQIISCKEDYYLQDNVCIKCSTTYGDGCEKCDSFQCIKCSESTVFNEGNCSIPNHCIHISNGICYLCEEFYFPNGTYCFDLRTYLSGNEYCFLSIFDECFWCKDGFSLFPNGSCIKAPIDNCLESTELGCLRCDEGFFMDEYSHCISCPDNCKTCVNSSYCIKCYPHYSLTNSRQCQNASLFSGTCEIITSFGNGCAYCHKGYFRFGLECEQCPRTCSSCMSFDKCTSCLDGHYMDNNAHCHNFSENVGCINTTTEHIGCSDCSEGYFLNQYMCFPCSSNCNSCSRFFNNCISCNENDVLIHSNCFAMSLVEHCVLVKNSRCIECSIGYEVDIDGTFCSLKIVLWVHLFFSVCIILICLISIIIFCIMLNKWLSHRKYKKLKKSKHVFNISKKKIELIENGDRLLVDSQTLLFGDLGEEIDVNSTSKTTFVVANKRRNPIKVDFILNKKTHRYKLTISPATIILKKNEGCTFTIKLRPLCSCRIEDRFTVICEDIRTNEFFKKEIHIEAQTLLSTLLDYEEISISKKIAEGTLGVVFKGEFRGSIVAVKKMKDIFGKDNYEEFKKEIDMLNKFRCEYIVHFHGAVITRDQICIVTEYAPYGSCEELMSKTVKHAKLIPSMNMRIKISKDISLAVQYLHSNGILHRDIKLANVLIVSLENSLKVNAKLGDFGSSRNMNLLINNMTFTKGIGSPIYMSPEVLQRRNYTMSADIYSLAISMFEIMSWKEAYPKDDPKFKFQWQIADYVCNGKRPSTIFLSENAQKLFELMWCQEPGNRISIDFVLKHLQTL